MKKVKEMYKEISGYEKNEIFLKENNNLCPEVGQKLKAGTMVATITTITYNLNTHSISITTDQGQTINRSALVKMIEADQIEEI